jgi:hypothetical protein
MNTTDNQPGPRSSTLRKAGLFYFVFVMFSYTTGGRAAMLPAQLLSVLHLP